MASSYLKSDIPEDLLIYFEPVEIGLEKTPEEFIQNLVEVFHECKRVLRDDGTLWVNIGDSYAGYWGDKKAKLENRPSVGDKNGYSMNSRPNFHEAFGSGNIKPKDLIGIPWMLAFALRSHGWYLRQDLVWSKPNPMPESVTDRCTKSHEYIFLLSKRKSYYYDYAAIKEPVAASTIERMSQDIDSQSGSNRVPGKTNGAMKAVGSRSSRDSFKREGSKREQAIPGHSQGTHRPDREESDYDLDTRNKRSVWTVTTKPFKEAHFATFPQELIVDCIKAGCPVGGVVLDPFMGAGTTGVVARKLNRNYIGFELNADYIKIAEKRIRSEVGLLF